jgi:hypothetical protein
MAPKWGNVVHRDPIVDDKFCIDNEWGRPCDPNMDRFVPDNDAAEQERWRNLHHLKLHP